MSRDREQVMETIRDLRSAAHQAGIDGRAKRVAAKADEDRARLLRSQARHLERALQRELTTPTEP